MILVPHWTEQITNKDIIGEDHLGIETTAINVQGNLLPGIITVTEHARYCSFTAGFSDGFFMMKGTTENFRTCEVITSSD